jgi:primosomal protein N' (replication factor Y) (superfamily II helicase)
MADPRMTRIIASSTQLKQDLRPGLCQVALDTPLRRLFDYRLPVELAQARPGARVRVPFGRQQLVGVLVKHLQQSILPEEKLRDVSAVIDTVPLFAASDLQLLEWATSYYHHPVGEVFATALPRLLREGRNPGAPQPHWSLTAAGIGALQDNSLRRAPKQQQLLKTLEKGELDEDALDAAAPGWRVLARKLIDKGWLAMHLRAVNADTGPGSITARETEPTLSAAQETAIQALRDAAPGNFLLDGVTGSGKTEVYLRAVGEVLARGGSALVLCPEIGLTPQLLERFMRRFAASIAALHSGLTDTERAQAWHRCATGQARIVIGTRSAVFTPIPGLALIIVDEEHDASYKQQEGGFRYSARDLALLRGQQQKVTVVLGSATPSLESLHNVATARLTHLLLPERAGSAVPPRLALIDMRAHAVHKGISMPVLQAMQRHLAAGTQVLVYLNRRGYAPTLLCQGCGWVAPCHSCDARMTVHLRSNRLACHHCGADEPMPERCPRCGYEVHPLGHGTERVEETLAERFPTHPIERFDRDALRQQQQLEGAIDRVHSGSARILVGTQMLTKGHHFPEVTLVVVLNADQSLFSTDFRAAERLAQTIVQVAGRAGRAEHLGEVLIQTGYPEHPLLQTLLNEGYAGFATQALAERQAARWPPFARLALLRASDSSPDGAGRFLEQAAALVNPPPGVKLLGPVPAAMMRRAGRHHAQLLVESANRAQLQQFLDELVPRLSELQPRRSLRWALDVDPLEVF